MHEEQVFFISFIKYKQSQLVRQVRILMNQHQLSPYTSDAKSLVQTLTENQ